MENLKLQTPRSGPSETHTSNQHPSFPLPLDFQIYCSKARASRSLLYIGRENHSVFYIGQESEPLYAVSVGYSGFSNTKVTLHVGPSVDSAALGTSILRRKAIDISVSSASTQMTRKLTRASMYTFKLPIGANELPESFEWRRRNEKGMEDCGGQVSMWELFRIQNPHSNFGEVVAVYSIDLSSPKLSGQFKFICGGATNEFNRDWVIMTVMTALSLGQKQRDNSLKDKQGHTSGAIMGLVTSVA